MKHAVLVSVLLLGGMLNAWQPPQRNLAPQETGPIYRGQGLPSSPPQTVFSNFTPVYIDSSRNQFVFWTVTHDPVGATDSFVEFIFRGYHLESSGYLDVYMSPDMGNTYWVCRAINADLGGAGGRYPSTIIDTLYPSVSWPELVPGPAWGSPIVGTTQWDSSCVWWFASGPDLGVHKANGVSMDNGEMLIVVADVSGNILAAHYDPVSGTFLDNFTVVTTGGFDALHYNNGKVTIFFDQNWGLYTISSTDYGYTWGDPQLLWQAPPNKWWWWAEGVVKNNGSPAAIICVADTAETVAPYWREIWYVDADGHEVRIDNDTLFKNYVGLAIDPESDAIYAIWNALTTYVGDTIVGYGYWDIFGAYSPDGGATWGVPENLTDTPEGQESMVHVAKEITPDGDDDLVWMAYAFGPSGIDPFSFISPFGLMPDQLIDPTYLVLGYSRFSPVGTEERADLSPGAPYLSAQILEEGLRVHFSLPAQGPVTLSLYDPAGRKVRTLFEGRVKPGSHTLLVPLPDLRSGVYFLRLRSPSTRLVTRIAYLH